MKNKICLGLAIIFILSVIPVNATAPNYSPQNAPDWRSLTRGDGLLEKVILCESSGRNNAVGKAGEIGLLQFQPATWELWTDKMNKDLDINNPEHQIEVYFWALNNGYSRHWTCLRRILGMK